MLTMTPDLVPGLDSRTVATLLGISYRQLDYAIRTVDDIGALPTMSAGSGTRRRFDTDTLRRLDVAAQFSTADPMIDARQGRVWSVAIAATAAGPTPPIRGFATLTPAGRVRYGDTLDRSAPLGPVGLIVRYDLARTALGGYLDAAGYPVG